MKRLSTRSLTYWGISALEAVKNQADCPEDGIYLPKNWYEMLQLPYLGIMLQYTLQRGNPLLPSVYSMEVVLSVEVKVPSIGVLLKSKLDRI
jgi:hypothetical protein